MGQSIHKSHQMRLKNLYCAWFYFYITLKALQCSLFCLNFVPKSEAKSKLP